MKWKCHEANERIWCENWKRNKIICSFVRCLLSFHLNQSKHISKETIWLLIWMNKSLASNFNLSTDNDAKHVFVIYVSNNYTSIILFHLWIFRALYFIRKNRFEYAKNIESQSNYNIHFQGESPSCLDSVSECVSYNNMYHLCSIQTHFHWTDESKCNWTTRCSFCSNCYTY